MSKLILRSEIDVASTEDKAKEKERFLAMCYFMWADEKRYGELHEELKKGVFRGRDKYPVTVSNAYQLLLQTSRQIGYQSNRRVAGNHFRGNSGNNRNFVLVQNVNQPKNASAPVPRNDGVLHEEIVCYTCRVTGHYSSNCPIVRGVNIL